MGLNIAFFGSSLLSARWNRAATYYRGIIRALHAHGHQTVFYEPDVYGRQQHRDIEQPSWAKVVVYTGEIGAVASLRAAASADLLVKASGVGVGDALLERAVVDLRRRGQMVAFWDVDAPATLDRVGKDPRDSFRALIPRYDMIFTYGGGENVVRRYRALGARACVPIYNALDAATHHPVPAESRLECDLGFLANRLPDREQRADEFFFRVAEQLPDRKFVLGGSGWDDKPRSANVNYLGHVYTRDHNAFNASAFAVLNVNRDSMASVGYSPATRIFEAAGAGACIITDAWEGIEAFFEPGRELLLAREGDEVVSQLERLTPQRRVQVGQAAMRRALAEHTYEQRALDVERALGLSSLQRAS
jgi:spore maturation protein CgeB